MAERKEGREEAFKAALLCTLHPYLKQDEEELTKHQQSAVVELLQSTLDMSPLDTSSALATIARQAQEPRHRLQLLRNRGIVANTRSHPDWAGEDAAMQDKFREQEVRSVAALMHSVLRGDGRYSEELQFTVLGFTLESGGDDLTHYVSVSSGGENYCSEPTIGGEASWTQAKPHSFALDEHVYEATVGVWRMREGQSDELVAKVEIDMEDEIISQGKELERWLDLPNSVGRVHIRLALDHPYTIFFRELYCKNVEVLGDERVPERGLETRDCGNDELPFEKNRAITFTVEEVKKAIAEADLHKRCYSMLMDSFMDARSKAVAEMRRSGSTLSAMRSSGSVGSMRRSGSWNSTTSLPFLVGPASWLLEQYALAYGVTAMYRTLHYLEELEILLEPTAEHISGVEKAVWTINQLELTGTVPRRELQQKDIVYQRVMRRFEEFFSRLEECFPVTDARFEELLERSLALFVTFSTEEGPASMERLVRRFCHQLLSQQLLAFEEEDSSEPLQLEPHKDDVDEGGTEDLPSPTETLIVAVSLLKAEQLIAVVTLIRNSVRALQEHYSPIFSRFIKEPLLAKSVLVSLNTVLFGATRKYCEMEGSLADPKAFDLYLKLREYCSLLLTLPMDAYDPLPEEALPLSQLFYGFIVRYLNETMKSMTSQWVSEVCDADELEPISEKQLHSRSVVQLFSRCVESYKFLVSLETGEATFLGQFAEIACKAVMAYVRHLKAQHMSSVNQETPVTKDVCVVLNNIEQCKEQLSVLMRMIEVDLEAFSSEKINIYEEIKLECVCDTFRGCFKDCLDTLHREGRELLGNVYTEMNRTIRIQLTRVVREKTASVTPGDAVEPLLCYLDTQVEILSFNLYSELFKKLLRKCWNSVVEALKDILTEDNPEEPPLSHEQIFVIRNALDQLRTYFCTDGQDVPIQFIDNTSMGVTSILQLCDHTSRQLVDLYHQQKDRNDIHLSQEHILRVLTMRARNHEPDAVAILAAIEADDDGKKACTIC